MVLATGSCTCEKNFAQEDNTHKPECLHVKLVKSEYGLGRTRVHFLVLLLYSGYVRCYQWGKLGEEYKGPLYYFCNFA